MKLLKALQAVKITELHYFSISLAVVLFGGELLYFLEI